MFSEIFYQPIEIISLVLHFISSWRSLILWSLITENELIWNATLCRHRFLRQFFLSFFTKCTFHSSFKVMYPKYYKLRFFTLAATIGCRCLSRFLIFTTSLWACLAENSPLKAKTGFLMIFLLIKFLLQTIQCTERSILLYLNIYFVHENLKKITLRIRIL